MPGNQCRANSVRVVLEATGAHYISDLYIVNGVWIFRISSAGVRYDQPDPHYKRLVYIPADVEVFHREDEPYGIIVVPSCDADTIRTVGLEGKDLL